MDTPEARDVSPPSEHAPRSHLRARFRWRRTLLLVPLAAGAVAAGGVPGFLLGFVGALLVLDRVLDRVIGFTGASRLEAEHRFLRLGRERRLAERKRRLRRQPRDGDQLVYLAMDTGWAAAAQRHARGVQPIAIESIVGTVDAHKASAFDRCFRPPSWSRGRWTLMCIAAQRGAQLPAISVYRVGNEHFVRDGHHRVSVARALGVTAIDAHVVELAPLRAPRVVGRPRAGWSPRS
jgi:hypothetical protein